ncbi:MAG: hypothetical protein N2C14_05570, partial [Planctomycetales bacterium]
MEELIPFLFLGFIIVVIVGVMTWRSSRSRQMLDQWAMDNGYEILSSERRGFFRGPFFWTTGKGQVVFYVVVQALDGKTREGWIRCGGFFLGLW